MKNLFQKTIKATGLTIALLLASYPLSQANAQQLSVGVWGRHGAISFSSSAYPVSVNVVTPVVSAQPVYVQPQPVYVQPQTVYIERVQVQPPAVYIEQPIAPDGYYGTGRACHANIVCFNGACYRCN
jgi:hypothetical protein